MATTQYTAKEIEEKRLLALQKKKQFKPKVQAPFDPGKIQSNENKQIHLTGVSRNAHNFFRAKFRTGFKSNSPKENNGPIRSNKQDNRYKPIRPQKFFGTNSGVTGKCYMITNERFEVEISSYLPAVIELFRTISSKIYDVNTKSWNFHLKDYDNLMEKLSKSDIRVIPIPRSVIQIFQKNLNSSNEREGEIPSIDLSPIDSTLRNMLMPFQETGVRYGISKNGRCIIADDMGLGKTIQALGIAHYYKDAWPLLIVAPSSVRHQWTEAIYNFLPSIPAHYIYQFGNAKDCIDGFKIIIVSYDLLVRATEIFKQHGFGCVILDESHTVKSNKTARFKAVKDTVCNIRHVILLSGTPALSRPIELYTQIDLVSPNFMGFQEYGIRYCAGERKSYGWDFTGSSNTQELQLLLKSTCIIRRLKSEVLKQLPEKIRQMIILDPLHIKTDTKDMEKISSHLQRKTLSAIERHTALLQYYHESSTARLKAVCNYVTHIFESKRKCLIFAHHQIVLDEICNLAESMKIKYIRIDGKIISDKRTYLVNKFQERDDYLVAVLSITAANAGITLTAARLVIFAELFWNPGVLCQAEDRVHRIGQDCNVIIQYLVARKTADDYIWPLIQKKMNVLSEFGLDQNINLDKVDKINEVVTDNHQLKIDSFMRPSQRMESSDQIDQNDEKNHCEVFKNSEEEKKELPNTENLVELLNLNEEDLQDCDWDDFS